MGHVIAQPPIPEAIIEKEMGRQLYSQLSAVNTLRRQIQRDPREALTDISFEVTSATKQIIARIRNMRAGFAKHPEPFLRADAIAVIKMRSHRRRNIHHSV